MRLVKKLLIQSRYSNAVENFEDLFSSHPNYPSLYAITDSLTILGIDNLAIKIPKEQFVGLPEVFLTLYKRELILLFKENESVVMEDEKGKKTIMSIDEFLLDWDQIIIAVEPNVERQLSNNHRNYKWLSYSLPVLMLIAISMFLNGFGVNSVFLMITSLLGLVLSVFILQEKLGIKTEMVSKFCNMKPEASCDSVIKSDQSQITKWLGFTDLPLLFFGINFFALLIQPNASAVIISVLSTVTIPFLVYSVWIQKTKIKKWCLLCLAVSGVVFLQGLNLFSLSKTTLLTEIISGIPTYLFATVLIFSSWMLLRPFLEKESKVAQENKKLKRLKRNFKVFQSLTKEVTSEIDLLKLEGIQFGKPNFSTNIILFLSPSCGHCHKAFEDAYQLYKKYPESVYLNILFNVNPENGQNPFRFVVEKLLQINAMDSNKGHQALIDWHLNKIGMEAWKEKWNNDSHDMLVNNEIHNQYNWCLKNELNFTPVKIINSRLFPEEYEISELPFFMNDFEEEFESLYTKIAQ
ncbi:vitamin K epoxide reductase family protein [Flavobacterium sp. GCM10027622]|uniref:vitamin K epoxide reductase family protein n=1 Tax=unclassified Flavobacterium TaxID=196869 RepID=UPI0036197764